MADSGFLERVNELYKDFYLGPVSDEKRMLYEMHPDLSMDVGDMVLEDYSADQMLDVAYRQFAHTTVELAKEHEPEDIAVLEYFDKRMSLLPQTIVEMYVWMSDKCKFPVIGEVGREERKYGLTKEPLSIRERVPAQCMTIAGFETAMLKEAGYAARPRVGMVEMSYENGNRRYIHHYVTEWFDPETGEWRWRDDSRLKETYEGTDSGYRDYGEITDVNFLFMHDVVKRFEKDDRPENNPTGEKFSKLVLDGKEHLHPWFMYRSPGKSRFGLSIVSKALLDDMVCLYNEPMLCPDHHNQGPYFYQPGDEDDYYVVLPHTMAGPYPVVDDDEMRNIGESYIFYELKETEELTELLRRPNEADCDETTIEDLIDRIRRTRDNYDIKWG